MSKTESASHMPNGVIIRNTVVYSTVNSITSKDKHREYILIFQDVGRKGDRYVYRGG